MSGGLEEDCREWLDRAARGGTAQVRACGPEMAAFVRARVEEERDSWRRTCEKVMEEKEQLRKRVAYLESDGYIIEITSGAINAERRANAAEKRAEEAWVESREVREALGLGGGGIGLPVAEEARLVVARAEAAEASLREAEGLLRRAHDELRVPGYDRQAQKESIRRAENWLSDVRAFLARGGRGEDGPSRALEMEPAESPEEVAERINDCKAPSKENGAPSGG